MAGKLGLGLWGGRSALALGLAVLLSACTTTMMPQTVSQLRALDTLSDDIASLVEAFYANVRQDTHLGPTFAGLDMATVPLEGGGTTVADAAYLTRSMMDPTADVHAGFAPIMPSYMGLLDAPEVAALVALIRSLHDVTRGDGAEVPLPAAGRDAHDGGLPLPRVNDPRMPAPSSPRDGR